MALQVSRCEGFRLKLWVFIPHRTAQCKCVQGRGGGGVPGEGEIEGFEELDDRESSVAPSTVYPPSAPRIRTVKSGVSTIACGSLSWFLNAVIGAAKMPSPLSAASRIPHPAPDTFRCVADRQAGMGCRALAEKRPGSGQVVMSMIVLPRECGNASAGDLLSPARPGRAVPHPAMPESE
ncbi:hypothetical protein E2A64_11170 [Pseudohoeflea suaedae]|uniref:Uncharacterized protein n=1 Tax=Pseudohoeflea suaedae TaxID=877384 RepID=A0A4R5PJM2_9HYPH|nr:hypothetical protein [Pseudohoeflea suaedae]TDH35873.1 hypothetical protein E2A64_11170 [Pseudohoeflea suaedae]